MRCPKCGMMRPTIPFSKNPCLCGYGGGQITQRIYKYSLNGSVKQTLELPTNSTLLRACVVQNGTICLYAMVDMDQKHMAKIEVGVLGTGWDVPHEALYSPDNHFATVQDHSGYVWHIFVRNL